MANDIKLKLSRAHERDVHVLLGGHSSKSSGNQWQDAADGKTSIYDELNVAWDCKCVMPQTKSLSISRSDLVKITEQARGRSIAMPLRWYKTERGEIEFDMMLVPLDEYVRLRELAQEALDVAQ